MDKYQFGELIEANKGKYYRIAYSYVKNEHDALDIIGEAVYKGLKKLHSLQTDDYFNTWMTRVVVNTAIDFTRKNSRVVCYEGDALEGIGGVWEDPQPEDSLDLFEALDLLSEKDKACVILRYFEEYSFVEIAEILQEPEPTCKSRLYRALKKMRNILERN